MYYLFCYEFWIKIVKQTILINSLKKEKKKKKKKKKTKINHLLNFTERNYINPLDHGNSVINFVINNVVVWVLHCFP